MCAQAPQNEFIHTDSKRGQYSLRAVSRLHGEPTAQWRLNLPLLPCHPENDPWPSIRRKNDSLREVNTLSFFITKHFAGVIRKVRPGSHISLKGQDDRLPLHTCAEGNLGPRALCSVKGEPISFPQPAPALHLCQATAR